jgi:hypothetical protein
MANAWREHVKKTMADMKAKAKGGKIMLKDVLKAAGKTYKKSGKSATASSGKTRKRKTAKRGKKEKKGKSGKKH